MYVSVVFLLFFFFMILRPPRSTRTDTLFPYTTLFRSLAMTAAPAAMAEDVTYLLPAPPSLPAFGPWMVAQQRGYFKAEGLNVTFQISKGGVDVAKQVGAGNSVDGGGHADTAIITLQTGRTACRERRCQYR